MNKTCENCKHFRQHYARYSDYVYFKVASGHCIYPRIKLKYTDAKACEHWKFNIDCKI